MKTIGIINLRLIAVNQELAIFNCENSMAGVIHTTPVGSTTVVLDGGYVLGMYDCPNCAIDELTDAYLNLHSTQGWHHHAVINSLAPLTRGIYQHKHLLSA